MIDENEKEIASILNIELSKVDEKLEPQIPTTNELHQLLMQLKETRKKAFRKELGWFLFSAIFILSFYVMMAAKNPIIFITVQVLAVIVIPIGIFIEKRRQNRKEGVVRLP
ncbi:YxlC family protein [Bacillus sp. 03113]|uniref:YxlC family protein n=1 Tax=Bacillus sp. 03113 TaxID=2578211 RepID=UPI0011445705|nr:YxlC family protein [Bacillus sp. 03113]